MRLLFSMRHPGALRNFASTVAELATRGHEVHLAFMMQDKRGDDRALRELTRRYPSVTAEEVNRRAASRFGSDLASAVRACRDELRYRAPEFRDAHALRARAESRVPPLLRTILGLPLLRSRPGSALVSRLLYAAEQVIPADRFVVKLLRRHRPDAVLVTPLVDLGSDQIEYVKAARAIGTPSGLCVHSWDNLTNKGVIHVKPSRVFVWNDAQKREAVRLHGIGDAAVVVTGAPVFDQWFERRPSTARAEFCAKVGLPPERPFFVYLCSSQFIAPREDQFVRTWIAALRSASDARVRDAGVLVRLHPRTHAKHAERFVFSEFHDVAVWPRGGANPVDEASKNDYFDSLHHAVAAVGINTSAQIEAGIVGRTVFSIRVPEYADTQEGTLHFHYLLKEGGGLLHIADTLDEHTRALAGAFDARPDDHDRLRRFIQEFVRPHGLAVAATPLLAEGIEALAREGRPALGRQPETVTRRRFTRPAIVRFFR